MFRAVLRPLGVFPCLPIRRRQVILHSSSFSYIGIIALLCPARRKPNFYGVHRFRPFFYYGARSLRLLDLCLAKAGPYLLTNPEMGIEPEPIVLQIALNIPQHQAIFYRIELDINSLVFTLLCTLIVRSCLPSREPVFPRGGGKKKKGGGGGGGEMSLTSRHS